MENSYPPRVPVVTSILTPIAVTVVAVVVGLALLKTMGPLPLSVSQTVTQKEAAFQVTGKSEITSEPNEASVRLGVVSNALTVATAQDQANTVINNITAELQKINIPKENIQTANYNIYPQYDYSNGSQRITGYQVNAELRVKINEFDKLNQAIDLATANGANQVGSIDFGLTTERKAELTKQAREEAIKDAQQNAQELASLADLKLGRVINVTELPQDIYPVMPMYELSVAKDARGAGGEPTQIQPGTTTFNYQVILSYETL